MKITIIGATGQTGRLATAQAIDEGHTVTVLARDAAKVTIKGATVVVGDATSAADVARAIAGADAVVAILSGKTSKDTVRSQAATLLVEEMKKAGVRRLIWMSASGVGSSKAQVVKSSFVFGRIIMPLFLSRQYADAAVAEATISASDLAWTVVRPVELVDKPATKNVGATVGSEKLTRLSIPRADVAAFVLQQLSSTAFVQKMPVIYA